VCIGDTQRIAQRNGGRSIGSAFKRAVVRREVETGDDEYLSDKATSSRSAGGRVDSGTTRSSGGGRQSLGELSGCTGDGGYNKCGTWGDDVPACILKDGIKLE
jgi:hypothetical protein